MSILKKFVFLTGENKIGFKGKRQDKNFSIKIVKLTHCRSRITTNFPHFLSSFIAPTSSLETRQKQFPFNLNFEITFSHFLRFLSPTLNVNVSVCLCRLHFNVKCGPGKKCLSCYMAKHISLN
jgi:hypothetical protein